MTRRGFGRLRRRIDDLPYAAATASLMRRALVMLTGVRHAHADAVWRVVAAALWHALLDAAPVPSWIASADRTCAWWTPLLADGAIRRAWTSPGNPRSPASPRSIALSRSSLRPAGDRPSPSAPGCPGAGVIIQRSRPCRTSAAAHGARCVALQRSRRDACPDRPLPPLRDPDVVLCIDGERGDRSFIDRARTGLRMSVASSCSVMLLRSAAASLCRPSPARRSPTCGAEGARMGKRATVRFRAPWRTALRPGGGSSPAAFRFSHSMTAWAPLFLAHRRAWGRRTMGRGDGNAPHGWRNAPFHRDRCIPRSSASAGAARTWSRACHEAPTMQGRGGACHAPRFGSVLVHRSSCAVQRGLAGCMIDHQARAPIVGSGGGGPCPLADGRAGAIGSAWERSVPPVVPRAVAWIAAMRQSRTAECGAFRRFAEAGASIGSAMDHPHGNVVRLAADVRRR